MITRARYPRYMAGPQRRRHHAVRLMRRRASLAELERESGLGTARALMRIFEGLRTKSGLSDTEARRRIRLGRQQVNFACTDYSSNKPDISYRAINNRRVNIELDISPIQSQRHAAEVNRNDPNALNYFVIIHPGTGQIRAKVRLTRPGFPGVIRRRFTLSQFIQHLPKVERATPAEYCQDVLARVKRSRRR